MVFVRAGVEVGVHDQLWQKGLWKKMEKLCYRPSVGEAP